jgi:hypothetical protein
VTGAGVATCDDAFVAAGAETVTAVDSGDADFSSSTSAALTQTINPGATSTVVTSAVDPSVSGESVSYTATVSAVTPANGIPTGTATFMDGATTITGCLVQPLVGEVATCSVTYAGIGIHAITAIYRGDPNFTASTSQLLTQMINPATTSTSLASSLNPSVTGQTVTFTATVDVSAPGSGSPTGTVAFLDGGVPIAGCAARAVASETAACATSFDTAGASDITAVYNGDPDFVASTSAPLNQQVGLAESATTVTSPASVWASGQPGIFEATVSPVGPAHVTPTGTAAFMDAGAPIPGCAAQPVVSGTASCSVAFTGTGTYPITAVYSGNAALTRSTSPTLMLSVYDDPPTPDAGANSTTTTPLAYVAILGGVFLLFLLGCARLRRRNVDRD